MIMEAPYEIDVTEIMPSLSGRAVDDERVDSICESIRELGLQTPITVRRARRVKAGRHVDVYEIVAGQHRHQAMCRLEYDTIPCFVMEADDDRAQLWEIDENLIRAELTVSDRADYTARRKAIYERLHPHTKHGGDHGNQHTGGKVASPHVEDLPAASFSTSTAEATGRSRQSVERDARRGERIDPAVMADLRGTRLDKGTYLDALARLPAAEQRQKLDHDMGWAEPSAPAPSSTAAKSSRTGHDSRDHDAARETDRQPDSDDSTGGDHEPDNNVGDQPADESPAAPARDIDAERLDDVKRRYQMLSDLRRRVFRDWLEEHEHGE